MCTSRRVFCSSERVSGESLERRNVSSACGSGGFLIQAMNHVRREYRIGGEIKAQHGNECGECVIKLRGGYFQWVRCGLNDATKLLNMNRGGDDFTAGCAVAVEVYDTHGQITVFDCKINRNALATWTRHALHRQHAQGAHR